MSDTTLTTLAEAAEWFPKRGGRKLSTKAIRRRIHTGVRGVRLEARRCGGEWFTCREWVEMFLADVTAAALKPCPVPVRVAAPKTPDRVKRLLARRWGIHAAK